MSERRGGIPTITIDTTGMELYDVGAEKAYRELMGRFATEALPVEAGRVGVLGANPLDLGTTSAERLRELVPGAVCYGMGSTFEDVCHASAAEHNLVVAPSGLAAARLLEERFGTPYEVRNPLAAELARDIDVAGKSVLVVDQQVSANTLREELLARGAVRVTCATWFMLKRELSEPDDVRLAEEGDLTELVAQGGFDVIVSDRTVWPLVEGHVQTLVDVPQFAVSGRMGA
jgi:hypothetical protein